MLGNFSNFNDFVHMGGYAVYVWPAYGICALAMIIQLIKK